MYYLQSRYYDPEIGRFINADALVATGQGFLGNNMFTYCANNPVINADPTGRYPGDGTDPLEQLIPALVEWFLESDEEEKNEEGEVTLNAKLKKTVIAFARSFEFSAGIGLGYYGSFELFDVGFDAGMYGNLASIGYADGKWRYGQEIYGGITTSILNIQDIGFSETIFSESGHDPVIDSWSIINLDQEAITLFSIGLYCYGGGSIYIGFNIVAFFENIEDIYK